MHGWRDLFAPTMDKRNVMTDLIRQNEVLFSFWPANTNLK